MRPIPAPRIGDCHGILRRALARELHTAYVAPLLGELDLDGEHRVRAFLDAL